jgi:hypothetical protein
VAAAVDGASSDGGRRALIGAQLLSQAILDHRPAIKMLSVVTALEAMLLKRETHSQTMRLARHVVFFGCGRHHSSLCGRDRPTCPYLALNPGSSGDRKKLMRLAELGSTESGWRCSEWFRAVDWYKIRSAIAHGDGHAVSARDADTAEYWVLKYLTEPILDWLAEHPDDPVVALEERIGALPLPADWEATLRELASQPTQ